MFQRSHSIASVLALLALARPAPALQAEGCEPAWAPFFGHTSHLSGAVLTLARFDGGSGPELYAGGLFTTVSGQSLGPLLRWTGSQWNEPQSGVHGGSFAVRALCVFDDGNGPALYVAGGFAFAGGAPANCIARWDGASWSPLGGGLDGEVYALAVYDDGSGPALHAAGFFTSAGGVPANRIARWDGVAWSGLGGGLNDLVQSLAVYDDGSGPALHAGGNFTSAGGVPASRIARWDGSAWSALGGGTNNRVLALTVHDDGTGPALYAGGTFTQAGGAPASRIARWDGASWSALGAGVDDRVDAMCVLDDPDEGPMLCAGGDFTAAGGSPASRIALWDGTQWSALGGDPPARAQALIAIQDGGPGRLLAGGAYEFGQGWLWEWDGASWRDVFKGLNAEVIELAVCGVGTEQALYAGGNFTRAGNTVVNRIARFDADGWSALGDGLDASVHALEEFDDGSGAGPQLYAGGGFTSAGGQPNVNRVARWDGSQWSALGTGLTGSNVQVLTLEGFDDGAGPALFAGGSFTSAGGAPASRIARWDALGWSPLGSGTDGTVQALVTFDDGTGAALYAGGSFTTAGGIATGGVARWDGWGWSGLPGASFVYALCVHDDGSGPALYAAGTFSAASPPEYEIARWNGASWHSLGLDASHTVRTLESFDDGSGAALYAGGYFSSIGGLSANRIARWDGSAWAALEPATGGVWSVQALRAFDPGNGVPALAVGGQFSTSPAGDGFLACWQGCLDTRAPVLDCPESVHEADAPTGTPGAFVHFSITAADELDPSPTVVCAPPSGSFFPRGTTLVQCTATDDAGNESTCEFPVTVELRLRTRGR